VRGREKPGLFFGRSVTRSPSCCANACARWSKADHRLGLTESLAAELHDPRAPAKIRYTLVELLQARLYALAQGYDAQDDLDQLAHDPAFKIAVWDRPSQQVLDRRLASQPTQSRLIDVLSNSLGNRAVLREALADWCGRHLRAGGGDRAARRITVDIDRLTIETHARAFHSAISLTYCSWLSGESYGPR